MEKEDVNKIYKLKEEIDKASDELNKKANEIGGDVITRTKAPSARIASYWSALTSQFVCLGL